MWARLRLDIGWLDLLRALAGSLNPTGGQSAQRELESFWSQDRNDALACLSVRSGFDSLLQAMDLPAGSEILFSAVTLRDMPRIAEAHGLAVAPVDVCGSDFHIDVDALERAITPQSKVLVVAHLFGARPDMCDVLDVARRHDLYVVEDCAQAWCGQHWRGDERADASLFSFGAIKTATAMGGALCRVRDARVLARMRDIQSEQRVQASGQLIHRTCKGVLLKALSGRAPFGWIAAIGALFGKSIDTMLGGMTHGFDDEKLLMQLRRQPRPATMRLLLRRLRQYDESRISRRIENARRIITNLQLEESHPELQDERHSFWLFPYFTPQADDLVPYLRQHGFDTAQRGSMRVVPPPARRPDLTCPQATKRLRQTVFLPCYPEMPLDAIDRLCELIAGFETPRSARTKSNTIALQR